MDPKLDVVVVVVLAALGLPVVTSDVITSVGHLKCQCNRFGVYSLLYRATFSQQTGICKCNATLHVDGPIYNPKASKEGGVELLSKSSSNGCSYRGWRFRGDCWKNESVAI